MEISPGLDAAVCDRARLARDPRFDGRFFIAVVSTRIYCRPICPSPTAKRENVRFYRAAEEAVAAGFRPCLRCRPEAAPGTPAWNGPSTTVLRALRLIAEGAMKETGLEALSARLGVSARHLDRLFREHLGASPSAVARTSRIHAAKRLITDTDLPMFRVAAAAGFRSVRRFNDSIRAVYGRTPSDLRRRRPRPLPGPRGRGERRDEYVFRLSYRPPYDWPAMVGFLQRRAIPGVEQVASGAYRRTFAMDGRHGVVEVRPVDGACALEARIRGADPGSLLRIVSRLREMFDLGSDSAAIAERLRRDPLLAPLVKRHPGLRVPGAWDPFELAVRAVLGQQVTVSGASTLAGRIAGTLGDSLSFPDAGGLSVVFPSPRAFAGARLVGIPRVRAAAIRALARAFDGAGASPTGTDAAFVSRLAAIRGIGEWTVQYVAMRAIRQPDAFPAGDLSLLRAAGVGGRAATVRELSERAERWRPWRAYAAMHLWVSAGERPAAPEAEDAAPPEAMKAMRR